MKTEYHVLDNGRPATWELLNKNTPVRAEIRKSWANNIFFKFEMARKYAWMWIAPYGGEYDGSDGVNLQINEPYDYSGYGDTIEIREVKIE